MAIRNTLIGSHLWLPFSLIEIAFRNLADAAISEEHPSGAGWLVASGQNADGSINGKRVAGPSWLHMTRDDGSVEDPVRIAGRMASKYAGRDEIQRDDLIANLMLGFWIVRAPEGLSQPNGSTPALDVFQLVAGLLRSPLDDGTVLKGRANEILRIRNRLAHHEPLLFRRKHTTNMKSQAAKDGLDLVTSLQGAIASFEKEAETVVETARMMAPMASDYLDTVKAQLAMDIVPIAELLESKRVTLKAERDVRKAAAEAAKLGPSATH